MSFAKNIIKEVKENLIKNIIHGISIISDAYGRDVEEDGLYTDEDEWPWSPAINVSVDNSYLDVEDDIVERRKVVQVCEKDGTIFVMTYEGDEIFGEKLSVEELGAISDCIEETRNGLVHNEE